MRSLRTLEERVTQILEDQPETRSDDDLLIAKVMESYNETAVNQSFKKFMKTRKKNGLPTIESIRRTRQVVANKRPDLDCSKRKRKQRNAAEKEYKDYARKNKK